MVISENLSQTSGKCIKSETYHGMALVPSIIIFASFIFFFVTFLPVHNEKWGCKYSLS